MEDEVVEAGDATGVARAASKRLALLLGNAVTRRGEATLALSGGNTPRETYALLAREVGVAWSKVRIFWVDERAVPPDSDRSNYLAAKNTLLDAARIPEARVHRMPAEQPDRARAALDYEALVRRYVPAAASGFPSFDAMVLGMGDDGHTASLFPGEPTVSIADRAVVEVAASGGREARLTLTTPVIQSAAHVLVLLVGADKHAPLLRAWEADGEERLTPIRVVRACRGSVTWIGDRAAIGAARPG
jgi:6-phosphogluconolactonase